MKRCIVSVATGRYVIGQDRLGEKVPVHSPNTDMLFWRHPLDNQPGSSPPGSPFHSETPYAFKAHALKEAHRRGYKLALWCDACMVPITSLEPLWERIERDGYWISNNGFWNAEWTAKSAYPLLGITEEENKAIPHVVATAFGLNFSSAIGAKALSEYVRLAQNGSFCGPWTGGIGVQHRHDQTCLSVIAHRLGMQLTNAPEIFAYKGGETETTLLVADGDY